MIEGGKHEEENSGTSGNKKAGTRFSPGDISNSDVVSPAGSWFRSRYQRLYLSKSELQNAADAAALAGVSGLNGGAPGINAAADRAIKVMNSYDFNKANVTFP